jgi:putative ABC transport system ATP-binding protein
MLRIEGLGKSWDGVAILQGLDLKVEPGQHTLIMGPSGCGKSTLLHLIARLARPDAGEIFLDGERISTLGRSGAYRLSRIGLVFQDVHLIESLSVRQNIELVQSLSPRSVDSVMELVEPLGLADVLDRRVGRMSRGERQRVAIARAFANRPRLILADEPTASLDPSSRDQCLNHLFDLAARAESTVIVVSHDAEVSHRVELGQAFRLHNRGLNPLSLIRELQEPVPELP